MATQQAKCISLPLFLKVGASIELQLIASECYRGCVLTAQRWVMMSVMRIIGRVRLRSSGNERKRLSGIVICSEATFFKSVELWRRYAETDLGRPLWLLGKHSLPFFFYIFIYLIIETFIDGLLISVCKVVNQVVGKSLIYPSSC